MNRSTLTQLSVWPPICLLFPVIIAVLHRLERLILIVRLRLRLDSSRWRSRDTIRRLAPGRLGLPGVRNRISRLLALLQAGKSDPLVDVLVEERRRPLR